MLDFSNITLVVVGTRAHDLTKIAINDCLRQAAFGSVLIYTDDQSRINIPGARYFPVPDWNNKKDAGRFYYAAAAANVETPFGLFIEWDAGIFNPGKWRDDFLAYDYIGAPWNTNDDLKVGNGGFTLMSKRLGDFLCTDENRARFPVCTDWDVCRTQRRALEAAGGFTWAPYEVAADFAWELAPRSPNTFGYHGIFNWPDMIGYEETLRRAQMMIEDPYLLTKIAPLIKSAPWLRESLTPEQWNACSPHAALTRRRPLVPVAAQSTAHTVAQRRMLYHTLQKQGLKA